MFPDLDCQLGVELGLPKRYRDKPAFEIINDAHDLVGALTSRLITFRYSGYERFEELVAQYALADTKRIEFSQRLERLDGNAIEAVNLIDELNHFVRMFVDPWLVKFEDLRVNER
ncbi:hypothetical protein G6L26_027815 (plasmid) [Agrobacterium radiobacter]|uniref:Uncharacterized protein n=3 Tax=Rhizobiaceae TaxID=82115 RepID=A0A2Z2PFK3_AGRTU|nr:MULTISPECIES: hypothetical protein [Rhizobium/Agrobacterium group]AKC10999.1 hypothetical protein Ach5_52360 [Agrobacterium tumefaciens]CUX06694.1 conserved hypothetical protein [Agrobacterium fabacearum TT111]ASK41618.1 hypothetical protein [Agrobacterium tumefaciens]ASK47087.1 hypothetical protein [Agrobacterium radiobacter]AVH45490.1 hypothetical protein At1D1609_54580 [Agrobacterium tumefaciens]